MPNREEFCRSVKEHLKDGSSTITILAREMNYRREYVSNVLNGNDRMSGEFVRRTIKTLAKLGCIHERREARTFLKLMDLLDFSPHEWTLPPLVDLTETV